MRVILCYGPAAGWVYDIPENMAVLFRVPVDVPLPSAYSADGSLLHPGLSTSRIVEYAPAVKGESEFWTADIIRRATDREPLFWTGH